MRRHEIDYLAPSFLGEVLELFTWPIPPVRRSLARRQHLLRRCADGAVIARGVNHWVFVDTERGRPKTMPPEVLEVFDPARWSVAED